VRGGVALCDPENHHWERRSIWQISFSKQLTLFPWYLIISELFDSKGHKKSRVIRWTAAFFDELMTVFCQRGV
jgi:hypothetical protein